MFLKNISLLNFRNIEEASLRVGARINCLVGDNGAGKTGVLDAMHYLSMGRSALAPTDTASVMHGADFFVLDARYEDDRGAGETIVCSFKKNGGKSLRRGGKEYERLSDHIGAIPLVMVSPADSFLVSEAADERRRYLNVFLSQLDRGYLDALIRYNRILGERNRLLKQPGAADDLLDILDMQLAAAGGTIHEARARLVERLAPVAAEFYRELCSDRESVALEYSSQAGERPLADVLAAARDRDRACQFTTAGVHRDDLRMSIGGHPLRRYGSQGQQKSMLVALRLAQYAVLAEAGGERPILLLDDLFDKLDAGRVERLLGIVSGEGFGQIFITDCNRERLETLLRGGEYALYGVQSGRVEQL